VPPNACGGHHRMRVTQAKGILAWTVVAVLTFFLPLGVITASVAVTVTEVYVIPVCPHGVLCGVCGDA
jgi:hypothetical protein